MAFKVQLDCTVESHAEVLENENDNDNLIVLHHFFNTDLTYRDDCQRDKVPIVRNKVPNKL